MKNFLKLKVILPILLGLVIGAVLFSLGNADDSPGLSAIGLSIGFVLCMIGINGSGMIKRGYLLPTILFFFAAFIALITSAIWLDGEFGNRPWQAVIGYALALALFFIAYTRRKRLS